MALTPEDVLFVLNGCSPPAMGHYQLAVITGGSETHYSQSAKAIVPRESVSYWPFEKGEIVILNGRYEREPFGEGRKPCKWDIKYAMFDDLESALRCRRRVLEGGE